jgi:endonuclease YncB( thermonuclease family)
MKKWMFTCLAAGGLLVSGMSFPVLAETATITIVVDGKTVSFPDAQPEIVNNRTMVPISLIAQTMGAAVTLTRGNSFTIDKGLKHIQITWNSDTAYVNQVPIKLDVPAYIKNDRTYVPLRSISEIFSGTVGYDGDHSTVYIDTFDPTNMSKAEVSKVLAGDLLQVRLLEENRWETVRLIGVDAPEMARGNQQAMIYADEAQKFADKMLTGKEVYLDLDTQARDMYGRLLAYVYLPDGTFFNAQLVREGYARIETMAPDTRHKDLLEALLKEARADHKGIWALAQDPWNGQIISDGTVDGVSTTIVKTENPDDQTIVKSGNVKIATLDTKNGYVVIVNNDKKAVDLTGWKITEQKGNRTYQFPDGFVLPSGSAVQITSGSQTLNPATQLLWSTSNVWNSKEDTAVLYDAQGNIKSTVHVKN